MRKKLLATLMPGVAAVAVLIGVGTSEFTSNAAFEAPYYNININGGTFDGKHYVLDDGTVVKDAFFCDGTYTYFLQADGTPMKDRLTYHPDGEQIIYFDSKGHECFDTFAHVKRSIAGEPVDDLCYFGTTGNLYKNVITYNKEGTCLYYANANGVMERTGAFEVDPNALNYELLANGRNFGYANSDGTLVGFFETYEEVASLPPVEIPSVEEKYDVQRDENGNVYDLGGMEIIVRNWWSSDEDTKPKNKYEIAKQEYIDWAQETYNFTIKQVAISDWASAPLDFVDYVTTGGDDKNYVFTLRDDPAVTAAMNYGLMYDLSTLDCLDFSENKFQRNLIHKQYAKKGKIYAMNAGYSEPRTGVYFNKRLLEEAGIDPESIYDMQANGTWTWDAWTDIMEKVQRDIDNDGVIDFYGFDANYGIPVRQAVYSNGSEFVGLDAAGNYTYKFEDPATIEALEWINDVLNEYAIVRPVDSQWDYYKEAFRNGMVAFCPDEAYMGTAMQPFAETVDEIGFVQFPKGPEADNYVNCWNNNSLVIPACYDADRAWKIAFAWDQFTAEVPGFEDYVDFSQYRNSNFDSRAVDETCAAMTENGMITYHALIPNLDMNEPFLWNFSKGNNVDISQLMASVRDIYKAYIDEAN